MTNPAVPFNSDRSKWGPLQIAAGYLLLGALWILFSDRLAEQMAPNAEALSKISMYKGWGYVLVTAILLYWLIRRNAISIRDTNQRYKLIAENVSDVIWLLDPIKGRFKYISPSVLKLRGYTAEEVMLQPFREAFLPEDGERLNALIMERISILQAKGSGTLSYVDDIDQYHRDGSIISTEVITTYLFNKQNEIEVMGVARNITRRKQAEMNQRTSEKKYQELLEQASDGIFIADSNGHYTLVNEEACRLVGYTKDELLSMNIRDLVAPEDLAATPLRIDELQAGKTLMTERKLAHKNESRINCEISSKVLPDGSLQSIVRDITERKVTEDALIRSEKRYRSLFENMTNGYARCQMLYDENGKPGDFMYLDVNKAFKKLTGLQDVIGKRVSEVIPGIRETNPELLEIYGRVASTGKPDNFETYVSTLRSGVWFSVSAYSPEKEFFVAVFENITERKKAEESLQRSYKQLLSFIDQAPLSIVMLDRDMNYLAASRQWVMEYGRGHTDLIGRNHYEVQPDLPDSWKESHRKGLAGESSKNDDDLWVRADGTKNWLRWALTPWMDEHGKIGGIIISSEDISERKRAEAAAFKSELRYHRVLDAMMEGCQIIDFDWKYVYINDVAAKQGRRAPQELLNHTMMEMYPGIEQTEMFAALRRCMEDREPRRMENQFVFPDSSIGWFELSIQPAEEGIFILSTDITERKQIEIELRDLLLNLEGAEEQAGLGSWYFDNSINKGWWSRHMYQLFGLNPEDGIPTDEEYLEMIHPEDRELLVETLMQMSQGKFPEKRDFRIKPRQGPMRILSPQYRVEKDSEGRVIRYSGTVLDITERKQAEQDIQESERRYRELVQNANSAILRWKRDGTVIFFNEYAQSFFGYNPEEILGRDVNILVPETESSGGDLSKLVENVIEHPDQFVNVVNENICRDGRRVWMAWTNKPVYNEKGDVTEIQAVGVDITERKRAEDASRQSQENFARAFNSNPAALAITRIDDGTFLIVNDSYTDMLGYQPEEVLGHTVSDLNIYVNPEERKQLVHQLQEHGRVRNYELLVRSKSGKVQSLMVSMEPILYDTGECILSTFIDITERKQMEEEIHKLNAELEQRVIERTAELSEANTLLQAMMDNIPDHIYFKDRQSRFIRNSRAQAELMGLNDPKEVLGKSDFDFFPHAQRAFDEEQEVMRSGQPLLDIEEYVVWPSGRVMWVSTSKVPLMDQEGRTIGIFGISRDITERKHAEEKLQKAKTELETANKELETFSYSVSHDLRAPLRAIDGYTNILLEDYESILDEEGKRVCGVISRETKRMGRLIDDLLSFSRMGRREIHFQKIDMKALVASVLDELLRENERSRFEIRVADLPPVTGDSALLRQVWVNLLSNAIKFTSKKERSVIQVDGAEDEEGVIYSVRDNGAGFEMEYANKLFGVFQRLHGESEFEGTGVGLAIVQRVVQRHGGRIWAEGKVDEGATFHFLLPQRKE